MADGVFVETTGYEAHDNIGGVEVHAEIGWVGGRPVIDTLTFTRTDDGQLLDTALLRSVSIPDLISRATNKGVRLYADPEGKVPFDPSRQENETLETWAARLAWAATAMHVSPAEYIAAHQNITKETANQRLVIIRKMGLISASRKGTN
jgi:hypothetical protein